MKANITITLKKEVLDPQGTTVMNALNSIDGGKVKNVRIGKLIEIEIGENNPDAARETLSKMCEKLLSNPVTEDYHVELLPD